MKIRARREIQGGKFCISFLLEEFTNDEIYSLSKLGPMILDLPWSEYDHPAKGRRTGPLTLTLEDLPLTRFWFDSENAADKFIDQVGSDIKRSLDSLVSASLEGLEDTVLQIKANEEIRRINEGARKALDRNSKEYKEVIEQNREAFEKLSKL